ncbi:MAG: methyl-accepting chemotaxis protein, partial [Campylobacterota bacterium]
MFENINTDKKLLINMLITQVGFGAISIVAILTASDLIAIVAINLIFILITAYTTYAAKNRIVGGIFRFKKYLEEIIDFTFMRTNKVEKANHIKNDEIGMILKEMNEYYEKFTSMRQEDMKVLGEIILTLNKVEQGIFKCRVKSKSTNFMINALRKSLNQMLDVLEVQMHDIKVITNAYAKDDYKEKINISTDIKDEMLSVMKSINILGQSLATNAKTNLKNGQTLEQNALSMKSSMQNL